MRNNVIKMGSYVSALMYSITRAGGYFVSFLHSAEQYQFENMPGGKIAAWVMGIAGSAAIIESTTTAYGNTNVTVCNQLLSHTDNSPVIPANNSRVPVKYYLQESVALTASIYCTFVMVSSCYRFAINNTSPSLLAYIGFAPLWLLLPPTFLAQYSTQTTNVDENTPGVKLVRRAISLTSLIRLNEVNTARLANIPNVIMFLDTCYKLITEFSFMESAMNSGGNIALYIMAAALYLSNNQSYAERLKKMTGNTKDYLYFENALNNTPILGTIIIFSLASALKAGTGLLGVPDTIIKFIDDFKLAGNESEITLETQLLTLIALGIPSLLTMLAYFKYSIDKKTADQPTLKSWASSCVSSIFSAVKDNCITRMCYKPKNLTEELTENTPLIL